MPNILKRLSLKNLRQKSLSRSTSESDTSKHNSCEGPQETPVPSAPPVPPLPPSVSTSSDTAKEAAALSGGIPWSYGPGANGKAPPIPAASQSPVRDLADVWVGLEQQSPQPMAIDRMAGNIETAYAVAEKAKTALEPVTSVAQDMLQGIPALISVLEEVSSIHPAVQLCVGAFKVVYQMEMTRRSNDAKVIALHVEMRDMMVVLCQLKDIPDPNMTAPNGTTLKGRLQELSQKTHDDIRKCANACDTYLKKKVLVKVLMGSAWNDRLAKLASTFTQRKSEFQFALSIHTATGIDKATSMISDIQDQMRVIDAKMQAKMAEMLEKFSNSLLPEQRALRVRIEKEGGSAKVIKNKDLLKDLMRKSGDGRAEAENVGKKQNLRDDKALDDLETELHESPDIAIDRNWEQFSGKLEIMQVQIKRDTEKTVGRATDRIIEEMKAGPQNKIKDQDVYQLWNDMGWRGSAKASHFVLALRDHYVDKLMSPSTGPDKDHDTSWILEYLDFSRLRNILEAFDDDFSGFVSVSEINRFTQSRPLDWSLPDWIAWWAVGWQVAMAEYSDKIQGIFRKIFAILPEVLPANRATVHEYLYDVWYQVATITQALEYRSSDDRFRKMFDIGSEILSSVSGSAQETKGGDTGGSTSASTDHAASSSIAPFEDSTTTEVQATTGGAHTNFFQPNLKRKFRCYVENEEQRLSQNLTSVKYDIDALDTVHLVLGDGKIEKLLLPLLALLLQRHFEIICLSRSIVLDDKELFSARIAITYVFGAISERCGQLKETFSQQKLDVKVQFNRFSCGVLKYWDDSSELWTNENVQTTEYPDDLYEGDDIPAPKATILRFNEGSTDILNYSAYDDHMVNVPTDSVSVQNPLKPILGLWSILIYDDSEQSPPILASVNFKESTEVDADKSMFTGLGKDNWSNSFSVDGQYSEIHPGGNMKLTFKFQYAYYATEYYTAIIESDSQSCTGTWGFSGYSEHDSVRLGRYGTSDTETSETSSQISERENIFFISRLRPDELLHRPPLIEIEKSPAQAMWRFAISAVRHQVRRDMWYWSYFRQRRETRNRYLVLEMRASHCGRPLNEDERTAFEGICVKLTPQDRHFYDSIIRRKLQTRPAHPNAWCDACNGPIGGPRLICMDCEKGKTWNTMDICDDPDCQSKPITHPELTKPHLPTHTVMKTRDVLHQRQFGAAYMACKRVLEKVKDSNAMQWKCYKCNEEIKRPCWTCATCPNLFICDVCEQKDFEGSDEHKANHIVVHLQPIEDQTQKLSTEERLAALEKRLSNVEGLLVTILGKLDAKETL